MSNPFSNWTSKDVLEHNLRVAHEARSHHNGIPAAEPKSVVCHEPLAAQQGAQKLPTSVRVVSYRKRLIDPDNLCPKYVIDCLRYRGFIKDDTAADIEVTTIQKKIGPKENERTVIELDLP